MLGKIIILLAAFVMATDAACPNKCSNHGTCGADDQCTCHDNWGSGLGDNNGGDCSDRMCPSEIAWVDQPDSVGFFKNYAVCSGRGTCQYDSGECLCFPGYEGKSCKRQTCPDDCSGHGTCEYVDDIGYKNSYQEWNPKTFKTSPKKFDVFDWDSRKSRMCKCDPGYDGVNCALRRCPYGNDVLDSREDLLTTQKYQKQDITFVALPGVDNDGKTFALKYTAITGEFYTTQPIVMKTDTNDMDDFAISIGLALSRLPGRSAEGVTVSAVWTSAEYIKVTLEFKGCYNEGDMNLIEVLAEECSDGCQPKITGLKLKNYWSRFEDVAKITESDTSSIVESQKADYNSYECGNRGVCNYESGECTCFDGYDGNSCNLQVNLV